MAKNESENPEVRQLREIKRELRNIESNTSAKWWIVHGMLYGAGWIIGSLLAILILGWALSAAGIVPGINRVVPAIQAAYTQLRR